MLKISMINILMEEQAPEQHLNARKSRIAFKRFIMIFSILPNGFLNNKPRIKAESSQRLARDKI